MSSCEQMKVEPHTRNSRQAKGLFKTDLRDRISEQQDQANTTDDSTNSIELMTTQTELMKGCGAGGQRRRNTGEGNEEPRVQGRSRKNAGNTAGLTEVS